MEQENAASIARIERNLPGVEHALRKVKDKHPKELECVYAIRDANETEEKSAAWRAALRSYSKADRTIHALQVAGYARDSCEMERAVCDRSKAYQRVKIVKAQFMPAKHPYEVEYNKVKGDLDSIDYMVTFIAIKKTLLYKMKEEAKEKLKEMLRAEEDAHERIAHVLYRLKGLGVQLTDEEAHLAFWYGHVKACQQKETRTS